MAGNKTRPTPARVKTCLDATADPSRRADCVALAALIGQVAGEPAAMWGSAIVGFGSDHDKDDSGREGDACVVGFSSRKADIGIDLQGLSHGQEALLARLGKHKADGGCLHVKHLAGVDAQVLAQLVANAVAHVRRTHGQCAVPEGRAQARRGKNEPGLGAKASRTGWYGEPEQRRPGSFLAVSRVRTSGTAH